MTSSPLPLAANAASNPLGIPEYSREVTLEFKTEAQAQQALLLPRELPAGKELAFSLRWDDANLRQLTQKKTFLPYGYKATFFLNGESKPYFPQLHQDGCSIGNHSLNHPYLNFCTPNEVHAQIMEQRAFLEADQNCCINSLVFPYGLGYGIIATDARKKLLPIMGKIIQETGHLGGPDGIYSYLKEMGLTSQTWFTNGVFAINDSNPDPTLFPPRFQAVLDAIRTGKTTGGPWIVMGIHSLQNEEGFKILAEQVYAPNSNNPRWWYCNATDYLAYRYQYLHTQITKINLKGKKATFRIQGCSAPELGSNVPLTLTCTIPPKKLVSSSVPASLQKNDLILHHAPEQEIPTQFEFIPFGKTGKTGLLASLDFSINQNKLILSLQNKGKTELQNLSLILRLPPCYKKSFIRHSLKSLASGENKSFSIPLGAKINYPGIEEGTAHIYLQTDYRVGNQICRLHSKWGKKTNISLPPNTPRDCVRILGLMRGDFPVSDEYLAATSLPGAPLRDLGTAAWAQWHPMTHPNHSPIGVHPYSPKNDWNLKIDNYTPTKNFYLLEFETEESVALNLYSWPAAASVYLNGKPIPCDGKQCFIPLQSRPGRNRLVCQLNCYIYKPDAALSLCLGNNPMDYLPCCPIQTK